MTTHRQDGRATADGDTPDDGWGPTVERQGRRRRPLRLLSWFLLFVLALGIGFGLLVFLQIPRGNVDGLAPTGSPMHVLVVGSDSREGLTAEEQRELSTGSGDLIGGERTDTIFVMSMSGSDVALLSFPRDLFVTRCDGSIGRINVAQSIDGPGCLVSTIRELSGLEISHYVGINFGGFVQMVDAVGGVELCLEEPIADRDAGIDLPAGCQVLAGPDALGYVRVRKIDNDLERIKRQQRFVKALAGELTSPATLVNPLELWAVGRSVGGAVSADDGLGPIDLARLGLGVRGLAGGDAPSYTVPATPGRTSGGADVLYVDEIAAESLFARFRNGAILDESGAGPAPGDVRLVVLNGAGVSGLAGRVEELLEGRGFEVAEIGNADGSETTVVRHPPGAEAEARLLIDSLPSSATLEETSEVSVVTVVLGRDAAGVA